MNVLVLHDTCTELVSYYISCCLVHQLSSLSGMLSTINRVSSKTEHTVIAKCPLVTTLRYSRQDLHSLVQHYAKPFGTGPKTGWNNGPLILDCESGLMQHFAVRWVQFWI